MASPDGNLGEGLRINAVAELCGLSPHTIRAWERRYGVPRPPRSAGRQRLYSSADIADLRRMAELSRRGIALAAAAQTVLRERESAPSATAVQTVEAFIAALIEFDEPQANAIWSGHLAASTTESLVDDIAIPALEQIGDAWHEGTVSVAQEHFASAFVRGRLEALSRQLAIARAAPSVLLACLDGDQHELGLLMSNLLLRQRGLRTIYLGQSVPSHEIAQAALALRPRVVALHGSDIAAFPALEAVVAVLSTRLPETTIVYGGQPFETPGAPRPAGATFGGSVLHAAVDLIERLARQSP